MLTASQKVLEFDRIRIFLKKYSLSPLGNEKIDSLSPLDYDSLTASLELLNAFIDELGLHSFPEQRLPDLRPAVFKAKKEESFLEPVQFLEIREFLIFIKIAKNFLDVSENPKLKSLGESFFYFPQYLERLDFVFDSDGNIKDSASPELKAIRKQLKEIKDSIESKLRRILTDSRNIEVIQEQIITIKDGRWVIPVKRDFKGRMKGLVISTSGTGETVYLEPELVVEDNNRFAEQRGEEKAEILKILKRLTANIRLSFQEWEDLFRKTANLELLYSKARYAIQTNSTCPLMNQEGLFNLKKARHPLLNEPIPIDIRLGDDFNILIITGPNTGGKTVCLKTMGLLTLMARCGMFIPAQMGSEVALTDEILPDIGDEQSISQNLSTFSAHIENIKKILKYAGEKSLVLIDELGAGTDPQEGSSLAIAIIEELIEKKARVIITSHMERIKNMAFQYPLIKNAMVDFDLKNLAPRYKLMIGVTGKSYALEIASRLGIPSHVVEKAKQYSYFGQKDERLEDTLEKLNKEVKKNFNEARKFENFSKNLEKKAEELYLKEKELKEIENSIKRKEGGAILDQIKSVRKKLIKMIEEAKAGDLNKLKEKARELEGLSSFTKEMVREEKVEEESKEPAPTFEKEEIEPGDRVLINKFNKEGEVVEFIKEKGVVSVLLGSIKMKLSLNEISPVSKKQKGLEHKTSVLVNVHSKTPLELNIIGKRRDEALHETEQYVGGLILKNATEGIIIHGKGTGILKQMVLDYLKENPAIKEFKVSNDGGATLFKFK